MAISDTEDERGLALRVAGGDQEAFEDLYRRYSQHLHDFALRATHDRELAANVVQATFIKAWETLRRSPAPKDVKAWLFTLARSATIDVIRHRSSAAYAAEAGQAAAIDFARVDPGRLSDPAPVVRDQELIAITWSAAAAISPSDYMLLDMNLRQEITPERMAEALGSRRGAMYVRLSRLKDALEETVTYTLLLRRGRRECPELDALLANVDPDHLDAASRRLIDRHLAECEACSDFQMRYPSPAGVFAGLAVLPLTAAVEQSIWNGLSEQLQRADLVRGPLIPWRRVPAPRLAAAVAGVAVLAIGLLWFTNSTRNAVHDPADVHSTDHQVGQGSPSRIVTVTWTQQPDAEAFGTRWSQQPRDVPEAVAVLDGSATGASSPPLEDGTWYFHLRTQGHNGRWTSTVHLGPFIISSPPAPPTPTVPPPTATVVAEASPTAQPSPTPPPPPTATATPFRPSATPTRPATATATPPRPTTTATATVPAKPAATAPPAPTAPPSAPPPSAPASALASACPAFGGTALAATAGTGNKVSLSWNAFGGCGPFRGTITARYQQDPTAYTSYTVNQTAGLLVDTPPLRCQGSFPVVYTLSVQDASGQATSANASTTVVWSC